MLEVEKEFFPLKFNGSFICVSSCFISETP